MHHVTTHGAQKITMDSKERDYQERLRQAKAQGDGNPNVMGVQEPPIKEAQIVTAANTPVEQAQNVSGDAELGTSMTESASKNPDEFQTDALERRLGMYTQAASNAGYSLNDRTSTGRL